MGVLRCQDLTSVDNSTILAMLYASRLSIGFAIGIICCTVSNYQTESCPTAMRGLIGTVFQVRWRSAPRLAGWLAGWVHFEAAGPRPLCDFLPPHTCPLASGLTVRRAGDVVSARGPRSPSCWVC
jgi:MFS family permease